MRRKATGSELALFVFIVLISLAFAGCAARGADFTTVYGNEGAFGYNEGAFGYKESDEGITYGVSAIARSLDELKELCAEWNNPAFTEGAEGYDGELPGKLRAYDEEFFSEKSLVIVFLFGVNGAREPKLEKLTVKEGALEAEISLKKGNFSDVAEAWIFVAETEASAVATAEKITVTTSERRK